MQKAFLDTNILVDLIADRKPFSKFAIEIFNLSEQKKIKLYTSSHSIATTHYLLKKYLEEKELRSVLYDLLSFIKIIPIGIDTLKKGLRSSHKDFEDAIQIISAGTIEEIDCIITRNIKDFRESDIPVYSPDEFILILGKT